MTNSTIDESQRKAARVVGFHWAMVAAILEFSVRARLICLPMPQSTLGSWCTWQWRIMWESLVTMKR
jgi:hypothetical protein